MIYCYPAKLEPTLTLVSCSRYFTIWPQVVFLALSFLITFQAAYILTRMHHLQVSSLYWVDICCFFCLSQSETTLMSSWRINPFIHSVQALLLVVLHLLGWACDSCLSNHIPCRNEWFWNGHVTQSKPEMLRFLLGLLGKRLALNSLKLCGCEARAAFVVLLLSDKNPAENS